MARLSRRFAAFLLLAAFVGGGFGLADLDALLYHSGRTAPEVPHFDLPGGCGAHAEHCVLAVAASLRQLGARLVTAAPLSQASSTRPLVVRVAAPPSVYRSFQDVEAFRHEIEHMHNKRRRTPNRDQLSLLPGATSEAPKVKK